MEPFIPIITSLLTGLTAIILRWFEKKVLKEKAMEVQTRIQSARSVAQSPNTQRQLDIAIEKNNTLIKKLSPLKFPNGAKILLLPFLLTALNAYAQRIETTITPVNDSIALKFNIYNDAASTRYLATAMITIEANYDRCDSGYQVTATTPVISDTSAHTAVPAQVLFSKNQTRYSFYFQSNHRLTLPAHSVTEIAKDTIVIPNRSAPCVYNTVFFNSQINNFISTSTGPGTNTNFLQDWWRFFITQ